MSVPTKNIVVLGSSGSIGTSALDVVDQSAGRLSIFALSAHSRLDVLMAQAHRYRPRWIVATDPDAANQCDWSSLPEETQLLIGSEQLDELVRNAEVDVVLAAIVGSAGLRSTWAAVDAGKTVALANKETLVMAGSLVTELAAKRGATILPVDSEHSAIFQAMLSGKRPEIERIVLTASGGPFREHSLEQLAQVTVEQALTHPTWNMGRKITIDSATMMNKALELIEAHWLFHLEAEKIDVVVHPQSIVHSMVEFVDGSVVAQLSPPDMKLPIQYALEYPERHPGPAEKMDWSKTWDLQFEPPDCERFPALELGRQVARSGGTSGAVLNAANEAAVAGFLSGKLNFMEITAACRSVLEQHNYEPNPSLEQLIELDRWAREEVSNWVCI